MWDLEHTKQPVYTAKAHASIINQIDGTGGQVSSMAVNTVGALNVTSWLHPSSTRSQHPYNGSYV